MFKFWGIHKPFVLALDPECIKVSHHMQSCTRGEQIDSWLLVHIGDHHTAGFKTKNGTVHTHIWSKVFLISEESYFMHNTG